MQADAGIQNVATVAWDGTNAYPADIRRFLRFSWVFEVKTTLTSDAYFAIDAAPPSDVDNCVPGAFETVNESGSCEKSATENAEVITIPAGTVAGTICSGTIPCRPNAFVRLRPIINQEGAKVFAVIIRQGPLS